MMAFSTLVLLPLFFAGTIRCQYSNTEITIDQATYNEQFFSFESRPDIEAPRWESKVYNQAALAPGYWFVSPYGIVAQTSNDHQYVAPIIYDSITGEVVWNGGREVDYFNVFSLQVTQFNGQNMLSFLQPAESQGVVMNNHYAPVRHVRVGTSGSTGNMHDFQIVDDGTKALYLTNLRKQISRERSRYYDYDGECEVIFAGIQERDLETDRVLFEWDSDDHIPLSESYVHPLPEGFPQYNNTKNCDNGWGVDYIHGNSIEKLLDGDYLMSSRHMYALYKISHVDGSIVWRLGGKKSDFTMAPGTHFSAQHDARCLFQNSTHMTISVMDNAVGVWEDVGYHSNPNSRGLVMSLNLETMVATEIAHYDHPEGKGAYAFERGNVQTMPNGNVFITWTVSAQHSEYTSDGTLIAEAKLLSPLKTYRSFKYPWMGHAARKPDVRSEVISDPVTGELRTVAHVSWNGDTQAATWRIYETNEFGTTAELVNRTRKAGFETTLSYEGLLPFVKVDALDKAGKLLEGSSSGPVQTVFVPAPGSTKIDLVRPSNADVANGAHDAHDAHEPVEPTPAVVDTGATKVNEAPEVDEAAEANKNVESADEDRANGRTWSIEGYGTTDPVLCFFVGIILGALLLLGLRRMNWLRLFQRRRGKFAYAALDDDEEKLDRFEDTSLLPGSDEGRRTRSGSLHSD